MYSIYHYCHVLPVFNKEESFETIEEAEINLKNYKHKETSCCKWFIQKEHNGGYKGD